jgi:ankyrin repeat protein
MLAAGQERGASSTYDMRTLLSKRLRALRGFRFLSGSSVPRCAGAFRVSRLVRVRRGLDGSSLRDPGGSRGLLILCGSVLVATLSAGGAEVRLIEAVKAGNTESIRALLKSSADVNAAEPDGTTALHWAVRADDLEVTRLLLEAGARVRVANRYGVTPISLAAGNGNAAIVEMLLSAGADANASLPQGESVLMTASRGGSTDVVKALLSHGARVDATEERLGETALMWAAAHNHPDVVRLLIEHGAEVDRRSKPLDYTKDRFGLEGVLTILPRGSWTALMYAAREGAVEATRALADGGAEVNLTDPEQTTALIRAIVNMHYDVAGVLLEYGADPNIADTSNMAALYAVAEMETIGEIYGRPARRFTEKLDGVALAKQLMAHGAKPNAQLRTATIQKNHTPGEGSLGNGATPLMRAAKGGDYRMMQALIDGGADPTVRQGNGTTALMIAAGLGRGTGAFQKDVGTDDDMFRAVKVCLDRYVDSNVTNDAGQTALHFAVRTSDAMVKLLAEKGATLDVKDRQGRTPMDYARGAGVRGRAGGAAPVRESTIALLSKLLAEQGKPVPDAPKAN